MYYVAKKVLGTDGVKNKDMYYIGKTITNNGSTFVLCDENIHNALKYKTKKEAEESKERLNDILSFKIKDIFFVLKGE